MTKQEIQDDLRDNVKNKHVHRIGAIAYSQGHYDAKIAAIEIVAKYDELIQRLFDALCDRHADDYVDEIKEEYGYDH